MQIYCVAVLFGSFQVFNQRRLTFDLVVFWIPLLYFLFLYHVSKISEVTPTDLDHLVLVN